MTITDLFEDFRIPFCTAEMGHRHVRPGFLGIDCFSCSPNTQKWKLGIRLSTLSPTCWTCGYIRLDRVLEEVLKISPQEAAKLAFQLRGNVRDAPYAQARKPYKGTLILPEGLTELLPIHKAYLKRRGFDPEKIEALWGLRGIGLASKLAWRIFIPILLNGEIASWTTRSVSDEAIPPYVNASPDEEMFPLKSLLMGYDYVRHSVIVVEGPLDAIKIGPGAVATMGVNVTLEQKDLLSRIPIRIICLDAEDMAQRRARKLQKDLSVWPGETHNVVLKTGKDPSRASDWEVMELRARFLE